MAYSPALTSEAFGDSPWPAPSEGTTPRLQEHELDGRWKVFLLVGVAGLVFGLSLLTGPICWVQGRRLRRGYEALCLPVPHGAGAVESLGMLSTVFALLVIPIAIAAVL